ncbi:MAG: hypothetical protein OEN20_07050 [Gammaproteobacteria bacterium]|nr:hypothetical protein [Gammaproteobacteria bacterium]
MAVRTISEQQVHPVVTVDVKTSQRVLLRMLVAAAALAVLMALNLDLIRNIYFDNQITSTGYAVNGVIIGLFLMGMFKVSAILLTFTREERALGNFIANIQTRHPELTDGVARDSLIHDRYDALMLMHYQRAPINHSALAATLVASESIRTGVPRYVNNILILTGVFGTIVSLSIALLGASNLLQDSEDIGSMGLIVHGMSTALSTTITAIVAYLIFGYFFLKLCDVQTKLIGTIEEVTALHLVPRFQTEPENMVNDVTDLVHALRQVAENMQLAQRNQQQLEEQVNELVEGQAYYLATIASRLTSMRKLLREGFRLPDEDPQ